jgi:carbonic anhydrase/acetyltransferase-like protein (isoleucine patch superfamily)
VHATAQIAPDAVIAGDVRIGPNVLIGFGAILYAEDSHMEIEQGAVVGDNAIVHCKKNSVRFGKYSGISHGAVVCDGSLGDHAWVGINCVVLDGAFVADDCFLGSISGLLEGTRTTEGTFWAGIPAVELERRTEAQIAGQRQRATTRSSVMALQAYNPPLVVGI